MLTPGLNQTKGTYCQCCVVCQWYGRPVTHTHTVSHIHRDTHAHTHTVTHAHTHTVSHTHITHVTHVTHGKVISGGFALLPGRLCFKFTCTGSHFKFFRWMPVPFRD